MSQARRSRGCEMKRLTLASELGCCAEPGRMIAWSERRSPQKSTRSDAEATIASACGAQWPWLA